MADVAEFTDANFEREVLQSDVPVLVDFWAPWCGPCRMIAPVVEELSRENAGKAKVGKINIDDSPRVASSFGVASIPTLMVFRNGKVQSTVVGVQPKARLQELLDRA